MDKYISLLEMEMAALDILPKTVKDYYKSGATEEHTLENNRKAFQKYRIRPKCLVGVAEYDLRTTVLGSGVSMPVAIAPSGMQKMAHPDGEIANIRAAEAEGTAFILSTLSTTSLEDVAAAGPNAIKWFQLYIYKDRDITRNLVSRAEKAGYKALCLTVDTPIFGIRRADVKNKFTLPKHLKFGNLEGDLSDKIHNATSGSGLNEYVYNLFDRSLTWDDIKWLKTITKLPIVAKGVLRGDDAVKAAKAGCSGILVSNHGGRQLDGTPATIEALPEVVEAVKDYNVEVYLDGGVMSGTDVYKALALGARMVFLGRPALWGLTVGGHEGVRRMLNIMRTELEYTFQIAGTPKVTDITRDMVQHESAYYSKL